MCVIALYDRGRVCVACRGQSIKVFSQLLRKAKQRGFILPFKKSGAGPGGAGDGVAYEGATVLDPKIGESCWEGGVHMGRGWPVVCLACNGCALCALAVSSSARD